MARANVGSLTIEDLWNETGFVPNTAQYAAILHVDGPLYLPAGPGSGKTRLLLWRTLNLIVFHGVKPEEVYLSTFTEKAALQLKEGLRTLLGQVTNHTGRPYDLSKMYIGTVHSLCQRIITDRRFYANRHRGRAPLLLDELAQYFHIYKSRAWDDLLAVAELGDDATLKINGLFGNTSRSRHKAATSCISLFNRLSEECISVPEIASRISDPVEAGILAMYQRYIQGLASGPAPKTDFSLLQQKAFEVLTAQPEATKVFRHVIVDEYQDTNTIQERIFFRLAAGYRNICVVGDDDQALYRFRGAAVENFVGFPSRCEQYLGVTPRTIPLDINYRSRRDIVSFYTSFMDHCDWRRAGPATGSYRVEGKNIRAHSQDEMPAVVATTPAKPEVVCQEIAECIHALLATGKVTNANQIAFLFPSMKYQGHMTEHVRRMKEALEEVGLKVYAPRAGRFLEVEESTDLFGVYLHIFGKPHRGEIPGYDYRAYHEWLEEAYNRGKQLLRTIYELRKQYGFSKFIIVVPSIAIFEGVLKTFEITRDHFGALYNNEPMGLTRYDGSQLSRLRGFASSTLAEVMVMTLDAFNKATNNIYKASDKLPGERRPFEYIQETRPILILDEPQNMESDRAKEALRTLHPLFALRYSATHRTSPNLIYRLTPFDAYRLGLVKKIQVYGVTERDNLNQGLLALQEISTQGGITASVRALVNDHGTAHEQRIVLRQGDDL